MAELPISLFLTTRLTEFDPTFELRKGTGFEALFFKPMQFIVQPLRDEATDITTAQSFRKILLTDSPDSFNEESVDALASNLFVDRASGEKSSGVARVSYAEAVNREFPVGGAVISGNNGKTYSNPAVFAITEAQMGAQIENGLFFFDLPIQSDDDGEDTELEIGGLVSLADDEDVIAVTNSVAIAGGRDRETNTQLIDRTKNSIAVRDLVTGKGFQAIIFENFASNLTELQPIGFGEDEMMRDIVFNTHIGGKVDGYFKTPNILTKTVNFVGLLIDTTRQAASSATITLTGVVAGSVGNPNIDRSNGLAPIVKQVKVSTAATFASAVDLTSPVDLSSDERVRIGIDGVFLDIRIAGVNPAQTNRNEIVSLINIAFGVDVMTLTPTSIRITSSTKGLTSQVVLDDPTVGTNALFEVFGLTEGGGPYEFDGDGPLTFLEGSHYTFNDELGEITRVEGASRFVSVQVNGITTISSNVFTDNSASQFNAVVVNDILTILSGVDQGDFRIIEVTDDNNLKLDKNLTASASSIQYDIAETGIKSGELILVEYFFNPLSIDIGNLVKLDDLGKLRGIRPGRDNQTIVDTAFLRVKTLQLIDPVTEEPTGTILDGGGGYGAGGYGSGAYGIGSGADFFLNIVEPTERFSAFEDSFIVIKSGFQGFSFGVTFEYVPEVTSLHDFVRSETERVLDGDILMKHFIPAYITGTITYQADATDTSIPDNAALSVLVDDFINTRKSGTDLEFSDIQQFITRNIDPFDRFGGAVSPFTLRARIHNTDGSITVVTGTEKLTVPVSGDPFPKQTDKPLSPRISHWIADAVTLVRST